VEPTLLEREDQVAALAAAYDAVRAGTGRLTFVAGEAGAGKTALVRAFAAGPPAGAVLAGVCDPLETPRPLGPLRDVAPELARRAGRPMPDTASREDLLAFIGEALCAPGDPPVLLLEDVHWADQATIDLLRYAGRRLERLRALVLATLREEEAPAGSPIALLLGDLATAAGVGRLAVPPLSRAGTASMVAGSGLDPDRVHVRTGGNPFFVGEVLRSGSDGVPPTVRDAVLARFARLPDPARQALEAAAAIGSRVEPALLLGVVQRAGVPRWGVEEAVTAGFLMWQERDLAFRHDLARAAISDATAAARRQRLHELVLAELRVRRMRDGDHDELLRHAEAAGDDAAVLELAPPAARRAAALHAHREAAALLGKAIDRARDVPPDRLAELVEQRAGELYQSGQLDAAVAAHERAAVLRQALGDGRRQAWNLSGASRLYFLCGRLADAEASHRRTLEVLRTLPSGPELGRAHEAWARVRFMVQDLAGAVEEAELAERIGDGPLALDARVTAGVARLQLGDPAAQRQLEAALAEARELGLQDTAVRATLYLGWVPLLVRSYEGVAARLAEGLSLAVDRELPYWELLLASAGVRWALDQCRWHEVERRARDVLDRREAVSVALAQALVSWGRLEARRGLPGAPGLLDQALALAIEHETVEPIVRVWPARAEEAWLAGDHSRVRGTVLEALAARRDIDDAWWHGELAFWARAADAPIETRVEPARPFALSLRGDWAAAADWWRGRGCVYEAAMAVAVAGDPGAAALREALDALDRLGARPAADHVRRRLRELGVTGVPRGPRASTLGTPAGLTRREHDVLLLVAAGMSNSEIAGRLFLSPKTVERHLSGIFRKLQASSRVEAVAAAGEAGLLRPYAQIGGAAPKLPSTARR
jgi:DNA-binding CsgD family transcriptional regulator/tetratricopeptide (TPR) repeat protein